MNHWNTLFTEQYPITKDTEGDKVVYDTRSGVGLQGHLASWLTDGPGGFVYPADFQHGELTFQPRVGRVVVCLMSSPERWVQAARKVNLQNHQAEIW